MHDGDRLVRQLDLRIQLLDRRVIPGLDVAEEDLGERRTIDGQIAWLDAVEIDDRHDAAHHHRKLGETHFVELLARQRCIAGTESYGFGFDLLDAATGTDRLIVQSVAGCFFVVIGPFGIDRIREGRAGTGNVGGFGRSKRGGSDDANGCQCGPVFQGFSPCWRPKTCAGHKDPPLLSSRPMTRAAAVDLKEALHDGFGHFLFCLSVGKSEVAVSHRRPMSPFYKALVTVT